MANLAALLQGQQIPSTVTTTLEQSPLSALGSVGAGVAGLFQGSGTNASGPSIFQQLTGTGPGGSGTSIVDQLSEWWNRASSPTNPNTDNNPYPYDPTASPF